MMAIVLGFAAISVTFSVLVVSACALSSKISRTHEWEEPCEQVPEINFQPVHQSTS
ncbi:MAG: hypothetical protein KC419_01240 [Anaerolineales bacterium]|nr:hypothetical protein [Anaerolineales bacterium]MCA9927062.1 hypothetical protein [Anaerolineales bacterium]